MPESKKPSPSTDAFHGGATLNAVAGASSGAVVLAVLFPVDSLKTHMQERHWRLEHKGRKLAH